jgi:hypothetical protein
VAAGNVSTDQAPSPNPSTPVPAEDEPEPANQSGKLGFIALSGCRICSRMIRSNLGKHYHQAPLTSPNPSTPVPAEDEPEPANQRLFRWSPETGAEYRICIGEIVLDNLHRQDNNLLNGCRCRRSALPGGCREEPEPANQRLFRWSPETGAEYRISSPLPVTEAHSIITGRHDVDVCLAAKSGKLGFIALSGCRICSRMIRLPGQTFHQQPVHPLVLWKLMAPFHRTSRVPFKVRIRRWGLIS